MPQAFRYWAFISYHHRDRREAQWLHRYLERYRVPRRLVGLALPDGKVPARLAPVFRDRDELPSSVDLGGVVQEALRQSRYLIVLCSPGAAQSRWVNEEVRSFKRLGRERQVLCLRLDRSAGLQVFPEALLERYDAQGAVCGAAPEPLAADLKLDGRDGAALKLIAGMLGMGYDDLRRRERRRRLRNRVVAAALALVAAVSLFSAWNWQQAEKQAALRAQALQTRIESLYRNGREALLSHNEARAAVYLGEAYRLGLDTPALRFMLARAMSTVDAQALRIPTGSPVWLAEVSADLQRAFAVGIDQHLRGYALAHAQQPLFEQALGRIGNFYAAYGAGGRLIWLDSQNGAARELRLFDAQTGQLRLRQPLRPEALNAGDIGVAPNPLSDDERQVVLVAPDATLRYGQVGEPLQRLQGAYSTARYCAQQWLVTAMQDGRIELRNVQLPGAPVQRQFTGLKAAAVLLDCSRDGRLLAAAARNGAVRIWQLDDGELLMSSGHNANISELRFSGDGERLMTATRAQVSIWQSRGGALIYADHFLDPSSNPAIMSPDGRMLARLSEGQLTLTDADRGATLYSLDGHQGGANTFSFAPDGLHAISGGSDGALLIWRLPQALRQQFAGREGRVPALAFAPDGRYYVGGARGGLYDAQDRALPVFHGALARPTQAAFSADGHRLALAGEGGELTLQSLPDGQLLDQYPAAGAAALALQFDRSGGFLAEALDGMGTRIWDLRRHRLLQSLPTQYSRAFAFSPQQDQFAYGSGDMLYLQTLAAPAAGWQRKLPIATPGKISAVSFSADGRQLLALSQRRHAFVIAADSGRVLQRLEHPPSVHFTMGAFSPDGRKVAIAEAGKSLLVWHLDTHRYLTLNSHSAALNAVAFAADGRLLLSAGEDGQLKIWDSEEGELLYSLTGHSGAIRAFSAGFIPQAPALYSIGEDATVRLWQMASETRTPAQLQQRLRCDVAWAAGDKGLRVRAPTPQACAARTAAAAAP